MTLALSITPYKPRYFSFNGLWQFGDMTLKIYVITADSDISAPPEILDSTKAYIDMKLPEMRAHNGPDHGLGYAILHMGDVRNWLLLHFWAHEHIVMSTLASTDLGSTDFRSEDKNYFHACVWEHIVIDHENKAWVDKMMSDTHNANAYLDDRLVDGLH